jgi:hypothetical protein
MNSLDAWNERMIEDHEYHDERSMHHECKLCWPKVTRTIESLGLQDDAVLVRQDGQDALWLVRGLSYWTLNDWNTSVRIELYEDLDAAIQRWVQDTGDGVPVEVMI